MNKPLKITLVQSIDMSDGEYPASQYDRRGSWYRAWYETWRRAGHFQTDIKAFGHAQFSITSLRFSFATLTARVIPILPPAQGGIR